MKKTVNIITLGCRVNQYESCAIYEALEKNGYEIKNSGICDYYIVNTCAVTGESARKSKQLVRRCASKGKTLVIGCASQIDKTFSDIPNVVYVGGNGNKTAVIDYLTNNVTETVDNVISLEKAIYEDLQLSGKACLFSECRAFLKIQDGCNGKCTYCIIPKCRGPVRSRDIDSIVNEAKSLVENGYKEIILTGIEVSAYNKAPLTELIKQVSSVNGIKRLRLGSLSPNIINEKFLFAVNCCESFMPHMHLSLQSCSDKILQLMKRPYRKEDIFKRIALIREYNPRCMISADIIVGFPGESTEDFNETVDALKELNIFHVHSFPYSEREGTPAADMPNSVPKSIRTERNAILINECDNVRKQILNQYLGKNLSVLVEKIVNGICFGHTEEFFEACFENKVNSVGDIVDIKVESHDGKVLKGIPFVEDMNERKYKYK